MHLSASRSKTQVKLSYIGKYIMFKEISKMYYTVLYVILLSTVVLEYHQLMSAS